MDAIAKKVDVERNIVNASKEVKNATNSVIVKAVKIKTEFQCNLKQLIYFLSKATIVNVL